MISLSVPNYPIVEDTNQDEHIDQNDLSMTFTYAEHELLMEVMMQALTSMEFACPYGLYDLPIDSELVQRYTMIENLRERFNTAWTDRFSIDSNNEIH